MRLGGLITLLALAATTSSASAASHQVSIGNNAFSPAELTITQGDSVTWTWVGPDTNHSTSTTADGRPTWDSDPDPTRPPNHPVGDKFSQDFSFDDEYAYFCRVHSFMTGRIIVKPNINNPNPPTPDTVGPEFGTPTVQVERRRVRFRLDEPAQVEAKLRGPTRRTLKLSAKAGVNILKLPKRLKPGRYGLNMRATDPAGNKSVVARVKFRVR